MHDGSYCINSLFLKVIFDVNITVGLWRCIAVLENFPWLRVSVCDSKWVIERSQSQLWLQYPEV